MLPSDSHEGMRPLYQGRTGLVVRWACELSRPRASMSVVCGMLRATPRIISTPDAGQPTLPRRCGFRARLTPRVRGLRAQSAADKEE